MVILYKIHEVLLRTREFVFMISFRQECWNNSIFHKIPDKTGLAPRFLYQQFNLIDRAILSHWYSEIINDIEYRGHVIVAMQIGAGVSIYIKEHVRPNTRA